MIFFIRYCRKVNFQECPETVTTHVHDTTNTFARSYYREFFFFFHFSILQYPRSWNVWKNPKALKINILSKNYSLLTVRIYRKDDEKLQDMPENSYSLWRTILFKGYEIHKKNSIMCIYLSCNNTFWIICTLFSYWPPNSRYVFATPRIT